MQRSIGSQEPTIQLLALRYDRSACWKNRRLAQRRRAAAARVRATIDGSKARTITLAGTFETTRIGTMYVKKLPRGSAQRPAKISLG
jgi:hypothetical protein